MLDRDASQELLTYAALATRPRGSNGPPPRTVASCGAREGVTWTSAPSGATFAFPRLSRERLEAVLPRFLDDAAYGSRGLVLVVAAARARRLR